MKKVLGLMVTALALLVLMCSAAGAEEKGAWVSTYPKASESRLVYKVPDGVEADVVTRDGYIKVTVLASQMTREDWKLVMIDGGYPNVNVQPGVLRPAGYDACMAFNGAIFDCVADDFFNAFANDLKNNPGIWDNNHDRHENGETVGEIVADQCMFIPSEGSDGGGGYFICWMDKDAYLDKYPEGHTFTADEIKTNADNIFYFEWVETAVQMDVTEPFYVPFRSVSAAMMAPTKSVSIPTGLSIKSIVNGDITYLADGLTKTEDNVPVVFDAPAGAEYLVVYPPMHGSYKDVGEEGWIAVANDRATYYHQVHADVCVSEEQLAAVWLDASGNIVDYGIFWFHVETPDYMPGGYYVEGWSAPLASRVELINNCETLGVDVSYNPTSGIFHIGYDELDQITGDVGWVGIRVKAPEGATAARINHGGGNQIMGPDDQMASMTHHIIVEQSYIETQTVDEDGYITVIDMQPLRHYAAGPVDVYLQFGSVWPYGGGQSVIYWYQDKATADDPATRGNPLKIEYVADTTDTICVTTRTEIVESEDDITDKVEHVTCVKPGHSGKNWHLVIHRYPQRGHNACHWELYLENECGDYEPLNEETVFYMPYPNGHKYDAEKDRAVDSSGNECTYEIYHYNADYDQCEPVTAEPTPHGIRFKTKTLSPFVLDWGDFQGELIPDQGSGEGSDDNTGDNDSKYFNVHTLRLDRGKTTVNGGAFQNVQITTEAVVQINGGYIENMSIEFAWDQNAVHQQTAVKGATVELLNLIISNRTPTTLDKPVVTFAKEAGVGVVFLVIFEGEEAPSGAISGSMVTFEDERTIPALVLEGNYLLYNPGWFPGVTFQEVHLNGSAIPYAEFLAMIGQ